MKTVPLQYLSLVPITNGLGLSGANDEPTWPRYVRTTDIASPTSLRDDTFASQPPEIAAGALLASGDILMTAAGATIGKSTRFKAEYPACYAGFLARVRPRSKVVGRFLTYWMQSTHYWDQINAGAVRSTIDNFSAGKYRKLQVPVLDDASCERIADYLDRETAQIDILIAKQQQLIATLRERALGSSERRLRAARGTGERLKWILNEVNVRAGDSWRELPLLSVSISSGVRRRSEVADTESRAEDLSTYKMVEPGDLVVNRMRAFQGALGIAPEPGVVSPDYAVLRADSRVDPYWLAVAMKTGSFVAEMVSRLKGIGGTESGVVRTPRINVSDLLDIAITLPDLPEQKSQLADLEMEVSKIEHLIGKTQQFIAVSKERRAALITAAVTGELAVPAS